MKKKGKLKFWFLFSGFLVGVTLSSSLYSSSTQDHGLKTIYPTCATPGCHKEAPNEFLGYVASVSQKAGLIQIDTGQVLDVYFDDDTKVVNWNQPLNKLSKGTPIKIVYADRDGKRYATLVSVKPPLSVPENQRVKLEEVKKLWETKSAIIIDLRSPARHAEGHIPYTLHIPFPNLDAELPKVAPDKNQLIVFYSQGPR
jgi:hypothetical protein